jgi:hypothetical protein
MTARRCSLNSLAPAIIAFILIFSGGIALVRAEEIDNLAEGQRIAAKSCNGCHQRDLRTRDSANDRIPSFREITAMPSTTMLVGTLAGARRPNERILSTLGCCYTES